MIKSAVPFLGAFSLYSSAASGAEVSLIKGFYQSSKVDDGLESTTLSFGGRYSDYMTATSAWFGEGSLQLKSYSADSNEPDDSNDIEVSGGLKYFLSPITSTITPYGYAKAGFVKKSDNLSWSPVSTVWYETTGLRYSASIGLRFKFSDSFFMEIETELFESYLGAKRVRHEKTPTGDTESKSTVTDLFIDSQGYVAVAEIILGMEI